MKEEDRVKNLFEVLKRIDTYLVSTNQKLAIIVSYCAAVLGWLSLNVSKISSLVSTTWLNTLVLILLFVVILSSCICLFLAAKTIFPINSSSVERAIDDSLVFYGDIAAAKGGSGGYHGKISSVSYDELIKDLSQQIFSVSKILGDKFRSIKVVMLVLIFSNFIPVALLLLATLVDVILTRS
jgi:hypothetical protein